MPQPKSFPQVLLKSVISLNVLIDSKLKWDPHVRKTQSKLERQTNAITRIATSTWWATFQKAPLVYSTVVCPALTYGALIWISPEGRSTTKLSLLRPLEIIQNRCLRVISGAYRATPIQLLESETGIPPLRNHLNTLQAQYQLRTEKIGFNAFLARQRVSGLTPSCFCGYPNQTVKHIMLFCPSLDRSNQQLGPSSDLNTIPSNTVSKRLWDGS